jgi:hypothetical protein
MEKYKRLTWPLAFIIVVIAFYYHYSRYRRDDTAFGFFGEYVAGNISLDLTTNGRYQLIKNNTLLLSEGTFSMQENTLLFLDEKTRRHALLKYESEEVLTSIQFD